MAQVQEISPNAQQIEYWNATAGETWAQLQEPLDRQIEPLGLAAIDVLDPAKGEHIIDIGCGCGQTSLALAARVGPTGSVEASTFRGPCLRWLSADRARLWTCRWSFDSWTHKPVISDKAFSMQPSLALA